MGICETLGDSTHSNSEVWSEAILLLGESSREGGAQSNHLPFLLTACTGSSIVNRAPDFDQKDFDQNDHFNLLLAFGNHRNGKNMAMFLPFRWVPNLESWLKWSFWSKSISRKNLKIGCPIHYKECSKKVIDVMSRIRHAKDRFENNGNSIVHVHG